MTDERFMELLKKYPIKIIRKRHISEEENREFEAMLDKQLKEIKRKESPFISCLDKMNIKVTKKEKEDMAK